MAKKQQQPNSTLGVCATGDPSGESFALVRDDGRFFVRIGASGRRLTAWSLPGAKLFPTWDLASMERVLSRLGKASYRWRVVRVALCRGDVVMRLSRVDGCLSLEAVPFD